MAKIKIIYILIAIVLAGALVGLGYFLGENKEIAPKEKEKAEATVSQNNEAGAVGEVMVKEEISGQEAPFVSPTMPPSIFSTAGTITNIETDRIIVRSEGTNFADGVPRNITAIFNSGTSTFATNQAFRWLGLAGLKQLKIEMRVLIEGTANIRGKTEFEAKTVNIL